MNQGKKTTSGNLIKGNYQELFQKQKDFFLNTARFNTVDERISKLKKLRSWIWTNRNRIREAIYSDLRKPSVESDLTDIKIVLWELDHAIKHLHKWAKPKKVSTPLAIITTSSYVISQPLGVVLILAPWNFPFNLAIGPLVSAMAAGNCIIIKPSEHTPETSELIAAMVEELFQPEEVAICLGDHIVAEELLKLPFNHIFFTGSPTIGKKVMKAASEHLTSVTLELGGCNPAIIDTSAELTDTAQKILFGKLLNAGQSCLSVNFVFVPKSKHDKFTEELVKQFKRMYESEGTSMSSCADYGRIVNKHHYHRIVQLINDTVAMGAKKLIGGESSEQDRFISPVILTNVSKDAPVMKEEIFGPVLPVVPYENIEEVFDFLKHTPTPLALYIFSRDKKNIRRIIHQTSAGSTCINETTVQFIQPNLPFGGMNNSGIGKSHGYNGFLAFSNQRGVLKQRVGFTTFKIVYPPYTNRVKKLSEWIMKYF